MAKEFYSFFKEADMLCLSRTLCLVKLLVAFDGKTFKTLCEIKDPNNNLALNNALTICLARSKNTFSSQA